MTDKTTGRYEAVETDCETELLRHVPVEIEIGSCAVRLGNSPQRAARRLAGALLVTLLVGVGCNQSNAPATAPAKPAQSSKPSAEPAGSSTSKSESEVTMQDATAEQFGKIVEEHRGKVVLVDFWATYCEPCRKQFPHTVEMSHQYAGEGLATISVCCDDPEKSTVALNFLKKSGATFQNLRSSSGADEQTYTDFEIEGGALPHYKIYDRSGKLRHTFNVDPTVEKQFTAEDVEEKVKELLAEKS